MCRGDYSKCDDEPPLPATICFRCGVCCTQYHVCLSLIEARLIAGELGITWEEFLGRYIESRWPGVESYLLRLRNGACVFLEQVEGSNTSSCLIHHFKPSACKEWTPGLYRPECQKGLSKCWGLGVSASWEIVGTKERIESFRRFLESLNDG